MEKSGIKFIFPIGEAPSHDPELQKRIDAIPKDQPVVAYFKEWARVMKQWQSEKVAGYKEREKIAHSGRFDNVMRR